MLKSKRPLAVYKTGLKHLPALNDDEVPKLNHFIHDTRSEFSRNIRTYNMAANTSMNRHLSQALRDVNTKIEGLNRSQQSTYKMMCKIVELQKGRAREIQKKYEANPVSGEIKPKKVRQRLLRPVHIPSLPSVTDINTKTSEENNDENVSELRHSSIKLSPLCNKQPDNNSGEMIKPIQNLKEQNETEQQLHREEVGQEDVRNNVIPSERSTLDSFHHVEKVDSMTRAIVDVKVMNPKPELKPTMNLRKAFFTASLKPTLPRIDEATNQPVKEELIVNKLTSDNDIEQASEHWTSTLPAQSDLLTDTWSSVAASNWETDTVASGKKAMSLRARIAQLEKQHIKEFLKKQNLETKLKPYQVPLDKMEEVTPKQKPEQHTSQTKVNRSIAAERRKLAKLRSMHRKAVLNSENNYIYTRQPDGSFLPGVNAYKRKRFLPPSNREMQERKKMLKDIEVESGMNDEKIGDFFNKLNLPIEKTKKTEAKPASPTPEKKASHAQVLKRERTQSLKPLSEIANDVAYVRQYIRPADRDEYATKVTSWEQRY